MADEAFRIKALRELQALEQERNDLQARLKSLQDEQAIMNDLRYALEVFDEIAAGRGKYAQLAEEAAAKIRNWG